MFDRKSQIENRQSAFTLVEILVGVAVLTILGAALVGLMMAGVETWRAGEAARQIQEKVQALQRQIADDLAAAVLDQPPTPDFHYVLDTLWDLPAANANDPYDIVVSGRQYLVPPDPPPAGATLRYFAPGTNGTATVVLRIRVPFVVQAALLTARLDVLNAQADAKLEVGRNDPLNPTAAPIWYATAVDKVNQAKETVHDGWIGGGEFDVSAGVLNGDTVYIRATIHNAVAGTAQFLRGDRLRAEGRPVLILDCYRNANALPTPDPAKPLFRPLLKAYFENGSQVLMLTRTIPGETEKAVLRQAGSGTNYLNYTDPVTSLLPLGGRANVVYRFTAYPSEMGKPGLGVLKRSFEAPIGRRIDDLGDANAQKIAYELIPNVAHFGVSFWGGDTTTWELSPELFGTITPTPRPASSRWLSSRYLPEQAQVTLVVEPDGGRRTTTALAAKLDAAFPTNDTGLLAVDNTRGFYNVSRSSDTTQTFLRDPRHYVKIDSEWIYYDRVASPTAFLIPKTGRGQRGTTASDHAQRAEVLRGTTCVFTVPIPAFRHWQR